MAIGWQSSRSPLNWYRTCMSRSGIHPGWADIACRTGSGDFGGHERAMAPEGRGESAHRGEGPPSRVVIEGVRPEIDAGLFPIKRTVGEEVVVSADIFAEGHDLLAAVVKHRPAGAANWDEVPMQPGVNDRWSGSFRVGALGRHEYTIEAWV